MEAGTSQKIEKRIKFLSFILGVAGGVALVLLAMSVYLGSPFLIVPAVGLGLTTIPVVRSIVRLRKGPGPPA